MGWFDEIPLNQDVNDNKAFSYGFIEILRRSSSRSKQGYSNRLFIDDSKSYT